MLFDLLCSLKRTITMNLSIASRDLDRLKEWFGNYVQTFQTSDENIQRNIDLKEQHTFRVCNEILYIGKNLGLSENELRLTEIIALFHDIGRFEQYSIYKTFSDGKSVNHAELGIKIIQDNHLLDFLQPLAKEIVLRAIKYHNRPEIPPGEEEPYFFYEKIIRDADKLDIWNLITNHYHNKDSEGNGAIHLSMPDTPGFSDTVINELKNKHIVNNSDVRNLNDFKLLQLGWIFDINFQPSLERIKERNYLVLIRDVLPEAEEIEEIFTLIENSIFN